MKFLVTRHLSVLSEVQKITNSVLLKNNVGIYNLANVYVTFCL